MDGFSRGCLVGVSFFFGLWVKILARGIDSGFGVFDFVFVFGGGLRKVAFDGPGVLSLSEVVVKSSTQIGSGLLAFILSRFLRVIQPSSLAEFVLAGIFPSLEVERFRFLDVPILLLLFLLIILAAAASTSPSHSTNIISRASSLSVCPGWLTRLFSITSKVTVSSIVAVADKCWGERHRDVDMSSPTSIPIHHLPSNNRVARLATTFISIHIHPSIRRGWLRAFDRTNTSTFTKFSDSVLRRTPRFLSDLVQSTHGTLTRIHTNLRPRDELTYTLDGPASYIYGTCRSNHHTNSTLPLPAHVRLYGHMVS